MTLYIYEREKDKACQNFQQVYFYQAFTSLGLHQKNVYKRYEYKTHKLDSIQGAGHEV